MNMDKYFMWIHYERLHNRNKAKHNKTMCTFLGIYCMLWPLIFFLDALFLFVAAGLVAVLGKYIPENYQQVMNFNKKETDRK